MQTTDVVIIGAGPAGLSAAIQCKENGLDVIVLDEFPKPGGRLLGQLHQEPDGEWWNGVKETNILLDKAAEYNTIIKCGIPVHHIEKVEDGYTVHTDKEQYTAKNVLIATGAAESAAPVPGWTLPGVMSIGAAQVMTNVHRVSVGQKGIVVGVNVLSAAIARELQIAGIDLHSMVLPTKNVVSEDQAHPQKVMERLVRIAHLAPSKFIQFGSKFAKGSSFIRNLAVQFFPKGGVKMWGMPIHVRKAVSKINGTDKVESVTLVDVTPDGEIVSGSEKDVAVDFVCIAGGLYPLAELAAAMGLPFQYSEELGGHVPLHNEAMETSLEGVYVAGNITGIESAKVARAQGKVAGLSIVKNSGKANVDGKIATAIQEVKDTRASASIQFHPEIEAGRNKVSSSFQEVSQG